MPRGRSPIPSVGRLKRQGGEQEAAAALHRHRLMVAMATVWGQGILQGCPVRSWLLLWRELGVTRRLRRC